MDWDQYCDISIYNINDYMDDSINKRRLKKREEIEVNIENSDESINEFSIIMNSFYTCIGIILSMKAYYYARSFKKI